MDDRLDEPGAPQAQAAGLLPLLAAVVRAMEGRQRRERAALRFDGMDDLLRVDPTIQVGLEHPQIQGDPRRLRVLRSEMQRVCFSTTTTRSRTKMSEEAVMAYEAVAWSIALRKRTLEEKVKSAPRGDPRLIRKIYPCKPSASFW